MFMRASVPKPSTSDWEKSPVFADRTERASNQVQCGSRPSLPDMPAPARAAQQLLALVQASAHAQPLPESPTIGVVVVGAVYTTQRS
jgi:hypothetical protein